MVNKIDNSQEYEVAKNSGQDSQKYGNGKLRGNYLTDFVNRLRLSFQSFIVSKKIRDRDESYKVKKAYWEGFSRYEGNGHSRNGNGLDRRVHGWIILASLIWRRAWLSPFLRQLPKLPAVLTF